MHPHRRPTMSAFSLPQRFDALQRPHLPWQAASTSPLPMHPPQPGADTEEPGFVDEPDLPAQQPVEPDTGGPPREGEV